MWKLGHAHEYMLMNMCSPILAKQMTRFFLVQFSIRSSLFKGEVPLLSLTCFVSLGGICQALGPGGSCDNWGGRPPRCTGRGEGAGSIASLSPSARRRHPINQRGFIWVLQCHTRSIATTTRHCPPHRRRPDYTPPSPPVISSPVSRPLSDLGPGGSCDPTVIT